MYLIFIQSETCLLAPHLVREACFQSEWHMLLVTTSMKFVENYENFNFFLKSLLDVTVMRFIFGPYKIVSEPCVK